MSFQVMSGSAEEQGEWSGQQHRRGGGHGVVLHPVVGQIHHVSAVHCVQQTTRVRDRLIQGHGDHPQQAAGRAGGQGEVRGDRQQGPGVLGQGAARRRLH